MPFMKLFRDWRDGRRRKAAEELRKKEEESRQNAEKERRRSLCLTGVHIALATSMGCLATVPVPDAMAHSTGPRKPVWTYRDAKAEVEKVVEATEQLEPLHPSRTIRYMQRKKPDLSELYKREYVPSGAIDAQLYYKVDTSKGEKPFVFDASKLNRILVTALACVNSSYNKRRVCACHGIGTIHKASTEMSRVWDWLATDERTYDLVDAHWSEHMHLWAACVLELVGGEGDDLLKQVNVDNVCYFDFLVYCDSIPQVSNMSLCDSWLYVYPMAWYLAFAAQEKYASYKTRLVVGLGGPACAGKTHLAEAIKGFINIITHFDVPSPIEWKHHSSVLTYVVSQDAYFHNEERRSMDKLGEKGLIGTYDYKMLYDDVENIANTRHVMLCPVNDRVSHERVADRLEVGPPPAVVIVEGVHILVNEPPMNLLQCFWDIKVSMTTDEELLKKRSLTLKELTGECKTMMEATTKYRAVDKVNHTVLSQTLTSDNFHIKLEMVPEGIEDPHLRMRVLIHNDLEVMSKQHEEKLSEKERKKGPELKLEDMLAKFADM